ncbi:DUF4097 family beta strand repeat-containing protein [Streptomyces syringium]|uniref:DUF4097 family beta strand repeat-containing protein n=1 Tax=Streptomyces syringium TaxID=76729 RepID=UPI003452DEED
MVALGTGVMRREVFSCAQPVRLDVELGSGGIRARMADGPELVVEVRPEPGGYGHRAWPAEPDGSPRGDAWGWQPEYDWQPGRMPQVPPVPSPYGHGWGAGQGPHGPIPPGHGYVPGFGTVPPGHGYIPGHGLVPNAPGTTPAAEAVPAVEAPAFTAPGLDDIEISFSPEAGLRVTLPHGHPLWTTALIVDITAPALSRPHLRTGSGFVSVTGTAATAHLHTGAGALDLERAEGEAELDTGTGSVRAGRLAGPARLRTGSGSIDVGTVEGEVSAHTGTGLISVGSLAAGSLEAVTTSGEIRVGVRDGVTPDVDAHSGAGGVRDDLAHGSAPQAGAPRVRLRARTGSGRVWITRAV